MWNGPISIQLNVQANAEPGHGRDCLLELTGLLEVLERALYADARRRNESVELRMMKSACVQNVCGATSVHLVTPSGDSGGNNNGSSSSS